MKFPKFAVPALKNAPAEKPVIDLEVAINSQLKFLWFQIVRAKFRQIAEKPGQQSPPTPRKGSESSLLRSGKGQELMHKSEIASLKKLEARFAISMQIGFIVERIS